MVVEKNVRKTERFFDNRYRTGDGVPSYFGLGIKGDNDRAGRTCFQEREFLTFGSNPIVAGRFNKWAALDGGFRVANSKSEANKTN